MGFAYNGIPLTYPRTEVHVMGPGMDPSQTDQTFTTVRLKVRGYLNIALLPSKFSVDQGDVENTLTRIRHYMTAPRKALYYDLITNPGDVGPNPIINLPTGRDDANGPLPDPDAFSVVYTTPTTLEVCWAGTVKLKDCYGLGPQYPLSLRWEDSVDIDKYFKMTWRRTGTLIMSSLSPLSIDAHRRQFLSPQVPPGFARETSSYIMSRDGLRCDFAFVDGQMRWAPPYPAIDMDIAQQETFPLKGGIQKGKVHIAMRGALNANPRAFMDVCMNVGFARLQAARPLRAGGNSGFPIADAFVEMRESKDAIECSFSCTYTIQPAGDAKAVAQSTSLWWRVLAQGIGLGGVAGIGAMSGGAGGGSAPGAGAAAAGLGAVAGGSSKEGRLINNIPGQAFPWVGHGTSVPSTSNPLGFTLANQKGFIAPPASGVLLAPAIRLIAAFLRDPCGALLDAQPYATGDAIPGTDPTTYNTKTAGSGGATSISTGNLSASLSTLDSTQMANTIASATAAVLWAWDGLPGTYDLWQCNNEYLGDPGVIVVPTSDPAGTNAAIEHSSEMCVLRKRWIASRSGAPPRLPPRKLEDANWVFTNEYLGIREMRLAPDGVSMVYEASGIYEYSAIDAALVKREAELQPFLVKPAFEGPTGPARWVQMALDGLSGITSLFGGGGGNPLGGGTMPGSP